MSGHESQRAQQIRFVAGLRLEQLGDERKIARDLGVDRERVPAVQVVEVVVQVLPVPRSVRLADGPQQRSSRLARHGAEEVQGLPGVESLADGLQQLREPPVQVAPGVDVERHLHEADGRRVEVRDFIEGAGREVDDAEGVRVVDEEEMALT